MGALFAGLGLKTEEWQIGGQVAASQSLRRGDEKSSRRRNRQMCGEIFGRFLPLGGVHPMLVSSGIIVTSQDTIYIICGWW